MTESESATVNAEKSSLLKLTVVTTFLALLPTIYVAWISNSTVLIADLARCTVEFLAIFLSWRVSQKVARGQQSEYNFGFGKLEQLASLTVAAALFVSFLVSLLVSVNRVIFPSVPYDVKLGLLVGVLSILGNAYVWGRNVLILRSQYSPIVNSQRRLFRAKTLASTVVVVALGLPLLLPFNFILLYADPIGALIIAEFLLYSAGTTAASSVSDLVDRSLDEAYQLKILKELVRFDGEYTGFREVRSRKSGAKISIELFLEFDETRLLRDVHGSIQIITSALQESIPQSEVLIVPVSRS